MSKHLYTVSVPTTGVYTLEVQAESKEEAVEKFYDVYDDEGYEQDAHEFEFTPHIVTGNVFHGMQNSIKIHDEGEVEE